MYRDAHKASIDPKYADDIFFRWSEKPKINQIERVVPEILKEASLYINLSKATYYYVYKEGDTSWRKYKYFGSLRDTEQDTKRRKGLALDS